MTPPLGTRGPALAAREVDVERIVIGKMWESVVAVGFKRMSEIELLQEQA